MNKKLLVSSAAITAIIIGVVLVGNIGTPRFMQNKDGGLGQNQGPTPEQKAAEDKANSDAKKQFIEGDTNPADSKNTQGSSVVELSSRQESNNTVTVFTKLGSLTSGVCKLSVSNVGNQYSDEAEIIYQPEYSICGGFSVPVTQLGKGLWEIKLSVNSGGQTYSNAITYEVK